MYACNHSYEGGTNRMIMVQGWPGKKCETLAEKELK
jgi:hypothetical protein